MTHTLLIDEVFMTEEASNVGLGKLTINLNTIVTTLIGGIVIFLVTGIYNDSKTSARELDKLSSSIPYLQTSVAEVKAALAQMVTRSEFEQKQSKLEVSIEKLSDENRRLNNEIVELKLKMAKSGKSENLL